MKPNTKQTLRHTHPHLCEQLAPGWEDAADNYTYGSDAKALWQCPDCLFQWQTSFKTRSRGRSCPQCAEKRKAISLHQYSKARQQLALKNNPVVDERLLREARFDLSKYSRGSDYVGIWQCSECSHQWQAKISGRSQGKGCPECARQQNITFLKEKAKISQQLALKNNPVVDECLLQEACFDLSKYSCGSDYVGTWQCSECDYKWQASVKSRSQGTGCPQCATTGYNTNKAGSVYLICDSESRIGKIGISNVPKSRLTTHAGNGLDQVLAIWNYEDGVEAVVVEKAVLQTIRDLGVLHCEEYVGRSGWTETFSLPELSKAVGQDSITFIKTLVSECRLTPVHEPALTSFKQAA